MIHNEFDPERNAVINPYRGEDAVDIPEICIGIFSDRIVNALVERLGGQHMVSLHSCIGDQPIYRVVVDGEKEGETTEIALFAPFVGAPGAAASIEELIPMGGKHFVFSGSCGVLRHDIADGHLIIPTAAIRDEGCSYHYLPAADEIAIEPAMVQLCRDTMEELGLPYVEGKTWTTDAFYRETPKKVARRKEQGCVCVEMECSALAAIAKFRDVDFAQFFWAADNLDTPEWDKRGLSTRGVSVGDKCFAAAVKIGERMKSGSQE